MADRRLILPIKGASDAATFRGFPDGFSPLQSRQNFRARRDGRPGGRRRPCLKKLLPVALKDGFPVQSVIKFSKASILGTVVGTCMDMGSATTSPAGTLYGNVGALDDAPSMDWFVNLSVTAAGGPAGNGVQVCAWDPDGEFLAAASNYAVSGHNRFSVARIDPATGATVWSTPFADGTHNASVNDIAVTKLYTFVAVANDHNPGGSFLLGYRNDTGALAIEGDLGGWAREAVALAVYTDATGQEWLYVAFHGSAQAGTYSGGVGGGTIKAGRWASQFRAGITKYRVEGASYGGGGTTRVDWGTPLSSSDAYYEAAHRTWRFSEQNIVDGRDARPHGCEFTGLACGADGSVYFCKRNQGWGPNTGDTRFQPDGAYESYSTVGKISADGVLQWLADTDSILEVQDPDYPFPNDLSFQGDSTPGPSINAISIGTNGDVFAAGRRTANGLSAFCLRSADGARVWSANIMSASGTVREGCATLGADGNPCFGGDRNTSWDGASGAEANIWVLDKDTGDVLKTFDFNQNVSVLGVAAAPDGRTFFSCDHTP